MSNTEHNPAHYWELRPGRAKGLISHFDKDAEIAFTAVSAEDALGHCFALGIAEFGTGGYTPVDTGYARFPSYEAASRYADMLNQEFLKLDVESAARIVCDTLKRPANVTPRAQRMANQSESSTAEQRARPVPPKFTAADADRILGLADQFLEDWEEDEGKDAESTENCAARRAEFDAIRPLLVASPAMLSALLFARKWHNLSTARGRDGFPAQLLAAIDAAIKASRETIPSGEPETGKSTVPPDYFSHSA